MAKIMWILSINVISLIVGLIFDPVMTSSDEVDGNVGVRFLGQLSWPAGAEDILISNDRIILKEKPKRLIFANVGSTVELTCSAVTSNGEPLSVIWHKNSQLIRETNDNGSLLLRNVNVDNEGVYWCMLLASEYGILLYSRAKLIVTKLPRFTVEPQDSLASIGGVVRFQCELAYSNDVDGPHTSITWLRNGLPLQNDIQRFQLIRSGSVLQIVGVQTLDQGKYRCLASNAAGNITSREATLSTSGNQKPSESPLRFLQAPLNATVIIGETALFECLLDRDVSSLNQFFWERADEGRLPSVERTRKIGTNLEIRNVSLLDEGWYACVGKLAGKTVRHLAYLSVNFAPIIRLPPDELLKSRGEKARFTCMASGKPKPNIVWFRDGERISQHGRFNTFPNFNQPPEKVYKDSGHIEYKRDLVISSLVFDKDDKDPDAEDDSGMYQCIVTNAYGSASAAAALISVSGNSDDRMVPKKLRAEAVQKSRTVRLRWEMQEPFDKKPLAFLIHFHATEGDEERYENTRAINVDEACVGFRCQTDCCENTRLIPFTTYKFWISTVTFTSSFSGTSELVTVKTSDDVCAGSSLLTVQDFPEPGSVLLKWTEPVKDLLRGVTQEFRIQYSESPDNENAVKELFVPYIITDRLIVELKQGVDYYFRVIPKTRAGYPLDDVLQYSRNYPWVCHKTRLMHANSSSTLHGPSVYVSNAKNATKTSIRWSFLQPAQECNVLVRRTDSDRKIFQSTFSNDSDWSVLLTSLDKQKFYHVTVSCAANNETFSTNGIFYTDRHTVDEPAAPPPPPFPHDIQCVEDKRPGRAGISWKQMVPASLRVNHFQVRYSPYVEDDSEESLNVSAHVSHQKTTKTEMVLDNLSPGHSYLFAVKTVFMDNHISGFSDDITCTSALTTPRPPINVEAKPVDFSQLLVTWKPGSKIDEKIVSYYVRYIPNGSGDGIWTEVSVNGTSNRYVLSNMSADVYLISVVAENGVGRSPPSSLIPVAVVNVVGGLYAETTTVIVQVRISYWEGIIIGICIALISIAICFIFMCYRSRRNSHCSRWQTTCNGANCTVKKPATENCSVNFYAPSKCQTRELQTLLPPLVENAESDSKGGLDECCAHHVTIYTPLTAHHVMPTIVERPLADYRTDPLTVTLVAESSIGGVSDDHHDERTSNMSHSPATGSSLQSWSNHSGGGHHGNNVALPADHNNRQRDATTPRDRYHAAYQSYSPSTAYHNQPQLHANHRHYFVGRTSRRRNSQNQNSDNTSTSMSSSSSMPNLTDSGICIDDECGGEAGSANLHISNSPTVVPAGGRYHSECDSIAAALLLASPPTNGYYAKHLTQLKDFLIKQQQSRDNGGDNNEYDEDYGSSSNSSKNNTRSNRRRRYLPRLAADSSGNSYQSSY